METKTIKEERLYERLNLPIKVNYEVITRPSEMKKATSRNISGGGICLSLAERLLPTTRLNITVVIPKPKSENYCIKAKVVWSRKVEVSGKEGLLDYYDTGVQFLESRPIVIGKIVSYFYGRQF